MKLKDFYALIDYKSGIILNANNQLEKYCIKIISNNKPELIFNNNYILKISITEGEYTKTDLLKLNLNNDNSTDVNEIIYSIYNPNETDFNYKIIKENVNNVINFYLNISHKVIPETQESGSLYVNIFEIDYLNNENDAISIVEQKDSFDVNNTRDLIFPDNKLLLSSYETKISPNSNIGTNEITNLKIGETLTIDSDDPSRNSMTAINIERLKNNSSESSAIKEVNYKQKDNTFINLTTDSDGNPIFSNANATNLKIDLEDSKLTFSNFIQGVITSTEDIFGLIPKGATVDLFEDSSLTCKFALRKNGNNYQIIVKSAEEV